jgi:hypothetical protein
MKSPPEPRTHSSREPETGDSVRSGLAHRSRVGSEHTRALIGTREGGVSAHGPVETVLAKSTVGVVIQTHLKIRHETHH